MGKGNGEPPAGVRSVERAADILLSFSIDAPSLTLAEIAEATGLPKPTAYRLLVSMVSKGLVEQQDDRRYGLGLRMLELGTIVERRLELGDLTRDVADGLAAETGETVLVGHADWATFEVVIIAKREGVHPVSVLSPLGRRSPIGPGALGKALVSGLPEAEVSEVLDTMPLEERTPLSITDRDEWRAEIARVRERQYAIEEGEFLPDVSGVAAPFRLVDDRPAGAIAVVGPSTRLRGDRLGQLGDLVREAARRVSFHRLG